jgi:hypothetical protein
MTNKLLNEDIQKIKDKVFEYCSPDPLSKSMVRYYCLAIDETNDIYFDESAAIDAGYRTIPIPPTFVTETNSFMTGPPSKDGAIAHQWNIDVPNTRYIRGGNKYEFLEPFYVGEFIKAKYTIDEIKERTSSTGKALLFITNLVKFYNQHDELKCLSYETNIYQEI